MACKDRQTVAYVLTEVTIHATLHEKTDTCMHTCVTAYWPVHPNMHTHKLSCHRCRATLTEHIRTIDAHTGGRAGNKTTTHASTLLIHLQTHTQHNTLQHPLS